MRLQPPDQLTIVLLWLSAIFMAVKQSVESWPAARLAFPQMSAGWLNFVPLGLLILAGLAALRRTLSPRQSSTLAPSPVVAFESPSEEPLLAAPAKVQYNPALIAAREDRRVISALESAKMTAAVAVARNTARDVELELPTMKAALLSAHKRFQIPLPPEKDDARSNLEIGRRLIEKILPFLEAKHVEEARVEANKFNERFKPKDKSDQA